MKIGYLLLRFRRERRLSQTEIAEQLNVSQSTYCSWESDKAIPSARYYGKIASFLGLTVQELFLDDQTSMFSQRSPGPEESPGVPFTTQALYAEVISSQKQTIQLLQSRLNDIEAENEYLKQQLTQKTHYSGPVSGLQPASR